MIQYILTYLIIFSAVSYAVYSLVKSLRVKSSGSCGDSCACSAKDDIKKAMNKKRKEVLNVSVN